MFHEPVGRRQTDGASERSRERGDAERRTSEGRKEMEGGGAEAEKTNQVMFSVYQTGKRCRLRANTGRKKVDRATLPLS